MRTINLIVISFHCVITLAAQEPPMFERGEGRRGREALNNYLNLTDQQLTDMRSARRTFSEESRPTMQALRENRRAIREEMQLESPNPGVIGDLTLQGKHLRGQLQAVRTAQRDQLLGLLTEEQRGQVGELERALSLQATAHQAAAINLIEGRQRGRGMSGGSRSFGGKARSGLRPRGRMGGSRPQEAAPPTGLSFPTSPPAGSRGGRVGGPR